MRHSESVDDLTTALHKLAETCEHAAFKDDVMCNYSVMAIHDKCLSEELQLDCALTWEKALITAQQNEALMLQQAEIYPVINSMEVGCVAIERDKPTTSRRSQSAQREQQ